MWASVLLPLLAVLRPTAPDSANVVTIVAHDYALEMPDSVPAGLTTFRLQNHGAEYHIAALERLDRGKTLADFVAALRANQAPSWARDVGGPGPMMPGEEGSLTLVLAPGRYAVFCDISAADHMEHWKKGMIRVLTVTPSSRAAAPPASDLSINLVDYAFEVPVPITAGVHTIKVTNSSSRSHMLAIMRFSPGKNLDDAMNWDHHSPDPVQWSAGTTGISPGEVVYLREDFPPGAYGLFCFNDDPDGTSHVKHGMQKAFTVQ